MTFTTQPPTRAGAYWVRTKNGSPVLREVFIAGNGKLAVFDGITRMLSDYKHCEWSRLVPVSEVEKAWQEGCMAGNEAKHINDIPKSWLNSHARKVVEGEV
jgi:hypothetical protein